MCTAFPGVVISGEKIDWMIPGEYACTPFGNGWQHCNRPVLERVFSTNSLKFELGITRTKKIWVSTNIGRWMHRWYVNCPRFRICSQRIGRIHRLDGILRNMGTTKTDARLNKIGNSAIFRVFQKMERFQWLFTSINPWFPLSPLQLLYSP
jgi:hypothetical protein